MSGLVSGFQVLAALRTFGYFEVFRVLGGSGWFWGMLPPDTRGEEVFLGLRDPNWPLCEVVAGAGPRLLVGSRALGVLGV